MHKCAWEAARRHAAYPVTENGDENVKERIAVLTQPLFNLKKRFLSMLPVIFSLFSEGANEITADVTAAVIFIEAVLIFALLIVNAMIKNYRVMYVLTACMLALPLIFGVQPNGFSVLLMAVCLLTFWITSVNGEDRRKKALRRKKSIYIIAAAVFAAALVISLTAVSMNTQFFYQLAYESEGIVSRSLRQISGQAQTPVMHGRVSSGNNYRRHAVQMTWGTDVQPTETLYLIGFTGGDYAGGQWQPDDSEQIFHDVAVALDWEEWTDWVRGMFNMLYFLVNNATNDTDFSEAIRMEMRFSDGRTDYNLVPYNYRWATTENRESVAYLYYEFPDIDLHWDEPTPQFAIGWYDLVQQAYIDEIPKVYMDVPRDIVPRLVQLCEENPQDTLEGATEFIMSYLSSQTSYTLTPGRAPVNEDIVEYFLFENKKGYCVHYASAATLMYRLFGFPARYVSGYAVDPAAFEETEDGGWRTEVTDDASHAWTEIFIEDHGWVPIEVTPDSEGSMSVSYPEFNLNFSADSNTLSQFNFQTPEQETDSDDSKREASGDRMDSETADFIQNSCVWYTLGGLLLAAILLLPVIAVLLRKRRIYMLSKAGCRKVFWQFMAMLHEAGFMLCHAVYKEIIIKKYYKKIKLIHIVENSKKIVYTGEYRRFCLYMETENMIIREEEKDINASDPTDLQRIQNR